MTLQEAQTKFSEFVKSMTRGMSQEKIAQKQEELRRLLNSLPNTPEFDPIATAISDLAPKLAGRMTKAVLQDLQSRDAALKEATGLIARSSAEAEADARKLRFDNPKLIAAGLTESLTKLEELKAAADAGDYEVAAAKAQALIALIEHLQSTIKEA